MSPMIRFALRDARDLNILISLHKSQKPELSDDQTVNKPTVKSDYVKHFTLG